MENEVIINIGQLLSLFICHLLPIDLKMLFYEPGSLIGKRRNCDGKMHDNVTILGMMHDNVTILGTMHDNVTILGKIHDNVTILTGFFVYHFMLRPKSFKTIL